MRQSRTSLSLISPFVIVLQATFLMFAAIAPIYSQASDPAQRTAGNSVEILTQTDGVDFSGFLNGLCKSVRLHWYSVMPREAQLGAKGRVVIRFQIRRDGSLGVGFPEVEVTSGRKNLDDAAIHAIKHSAPFKRFPQEFQGPGVELRVTFCYNLPTTAKR
jgi:TonB family protein